MMYDAQIRSRRKDNSPSSTIFDGATFDINIETTETGDCLGNMTNGDSKTCVFINAITLTLQD